MARFITPKELKWRKSNIENIITISESISQMKSGCGWVLTGYTKGVEFDSLVVLGEGLHWNTLLQALPPDQICYAYARVEFGKLPGAIYLIIWIGKDVDDHIKSVAEENEKLLSTLFPVYEGIIYARSCGNLQSQITGKFTPIRHGSLRKKHADFTVHEKEPLKRSFTVIARKRSETVFFLEKQEKLKPFNSFPTDLKEDREIQAKIIVIGDIGVGKSTIIQKYVERSNTDIKKCKKEFYLKKENVGQECLILKIWDILGQGKYETLAPIWYRYAEGVVLVYDKTNRQSFENLTQWLKRIRGFSEPCCIILAGNKADLSKDEVITKKDGFSYAFQNGLMFIETCAKDGSNIVQLFSLLSKRLVPKLLEKEEAHKIVERDPVGGRLEGKGKRKRATTKIQKTQVEVETPMTTLHTEILANTNIKLSYDENISEILQKSFNECNF